MTAIPPLDDQFVALLVAPYLLHPKLRVGFRYCVVLAHIVSMPEAAIYRDDRAVLRQYDVWRAGEGACIQAVARTRAMEGLANLQLGSRVPRFDVRHHQISL